MDLGPAIALAVLGSVLPGCAGGSSGQGGGGSGGPQGQVTLFGSRPAGYLLEVDQSTGRSTLRSGLGLAGARSIQCLAFDPNSDTLYGADDQADVLLAIDTATGVATPRPHGLGFDQVWGLAFDPNTNLLYGLGQNDVGGTTEHLVSIDPVSGIATSIAGIDPTDSIAFDPNTSTLYALDAGTDELCTMDVATGAKTSLGVSVACSGLTFDPGTQSLYGWAWGQGLVRIDPATGTAVLVGSSTALLRTLAFDTGRNRLYGWGGDSGGQLFSVDAYTGDAAVIGQTGRDFVSAIAFDPVSRRLYGTSAYTNDLLDVDPATGIGGRIGSTSVPDTEFVRALAFDPTTRTLYGSTHYDLWRIDPQTGASTDIGPIGFPYVGALAFDPATGFLLGASGNDLIRVDPLTGAGTLVTTSAASIWGLAVDPRTKRLYGVGFLFGQQLFTIDPTDGEAEPLPGQFPPHPTFGLAFDPEADAFYSLENDPARLLRIRRSDGRVTQVAGVGSLAITGLAFDPRTGRVYGADRMDGGLYDVDPSNGDATLVGWIGNMLDDVAFDPNTETFYCVLGGSLYRFDPATNQRTWLPGPIGASVEAIAFDPNTNTLYGAGSTLLRIDKSTGVGTVIGPIGFSYIGGLAFDPVSNDLYGTSTSPDRLLLRIDTATGAGTVVGATQFMIAALTARVEPAH